ncbi:50S ribosomal protein L17 [Candidatus Gottesmanbacteria bacterium]|nr:50S ribosomal protein L17 [Candidatus Gottesmanbacteria bacterium]
MRHRVFGKKLGRDIKERKSLFKNLVISLINYGKIQTTLARAKAIQGLAEKLVSKAKDGSDSALRQVSSFIARREAIDKFVKVITPRFKDRLGGYLRLRRIGKRAGDASEQVVLEWTLPDQRAEKEVKKSEIKQKESGKKT